MRQLLIELDNTDKPVLHQSSDGTIKNSVSCLVDTGANIPVWTSGVDLLQKRFPLAYKTTYNTLISGFGNGIVKDVPIWCIPEFVLRDSNGNRLVFKDLLLALVTDSKFSVNMILSFTMFNRMDFSFSFRNSVNKGFLYITSSDREYYYSRPIFKDGFLSKIQVFSQGD